jgi:outer membrane murein-binding lipoprotein Lpp
VEEIWAAIIGALITCFLMTIGNISNRRERDIREIFRRVNELETKVARLDQQLIQNEKL